MMRGTTVLESVTSILVLSFVQVSQFNAIHAHICSVGSSADCNSLPKSSYVLGYLSTLITLVKSIQDQTVC